MPSAIELLTQYYTPFHLVLFYKRPDLTPKRDGHEFKWRYFDFQKIDDLQDRISQFLEYQHTKGRPIAAQDVRVAFRPLAPQLSILFVDDVKEDFPASFLIETSPGNFQAHIILDQPHTAAELLEMQQYLSKTRETDKGSVASHQARRLPTGGLRVIINDSEPRTRQELGIPFKRKLLVKTRKTMKRNQSEDGLRNLWNVIGDQVEQQRGKRDRSETDFRVTSCLYDQHKYSDADLVQLVVDYSEKANERNDAERYAQHIVESVLRKKKSKHR